MWHIYGACGRGVGFLARADTKRTAIRRERDALLMAAAPEGLEVAKMVLATIDPACLVENDIYGDSRERNAQFASLYLAAEAMVSKATAQ